MSSRKVAAKRPQDPQLKQVLALLEGIPAKIVSDKAKNLVGANTIYNWRAGKVARPQHYTLEAALNAVGYTFGIIKKGNK